MNNTRESYDRETAKCATATESQQEFRRQLQQQRDRIGRFVDLIDAAEDAGEPDPYAAAMSKMKATA